MIDGRAREWLERGSFLEWAPPREAGAAGALRIFHAELGDPAAPALLLVHGFPTSSIDWFDLAEPLAREHRVCVLDFPGFGFSEKPRGMRYTLESDRALLEHYVAEVLGLDAAAVIAHDRGDSVALALLARAAAGAAAFELRHLVISNGNMFLPLSNLTAFQRLILEEGTATPVLDALNAEMLAAGMGESTFTPSRAAGDPVVRALAQTLAYNDGIAVLHAPIQYLVERAQNEQAWLEVVARSPLPTTLVWGLHDTIAPLRVATHVWERYLSEKAGVNEFWLLPCANHYLQHDQPHEFAQVLACALKGDSPEAPGPLSSAPGAPILLDRSRAEMPSATAVLAARASLEELQAPPAE